MIATDAEGIVEMMNPVAETLTGWKSAEAVGRPLEEVFHIVSEDTRETVENPVRRVVREGLIVGLANHTLLIARDGSERSIADSGAPIRTGDGEIRGAVLVFRDVSEERRHRKEREITLELLGLLNSENLVHDLVRSITGLLQKSVGCEAVGIRLKDGDDYPYVETRGFSREFVRAGELVAVQRLDDGSLVIDADGHPMMECMCGNILRGRFDPAKPFFTPKGTFWSNSTTELLATTTRRRSSGAHAQPLQPARAIESVALVPLRHDNQTFGLLQFNDRRKNRFTPDLLAFLENVADQVAVALSHRRMARALAESEEHYRSLFENMLNGFAFCRMIYDEDRPVDFVYLEVNRAFETLTGLRDVVGKRVSQLIPRFRELRSRADRNLRSGGAHGKARAVRDLCQCDGHVVRGIRVLSPPGSFRRDLRRHHGAQGGGGRAAAARLGHRPGRRDDPHHGRRGQSSSIAIPPLSA